MSTKVTRDQFAVSRAGITHIPKGATYEPHPNNPFSGNLRLRNLGNKLPNGDDHRPNEVQAMMQQIWAEYVAENFATFER